MLMSELTQLHSEALRLLTTYEEYKDSPNEHLRRKVHLDLDRFLMQHRYVAAILVTQGLQDAMDRLVAERAVEPDKISLSRVRVSITELLRRAPWYKKGAKTNAEDNNKPSRTISTNGRAIQVSTSEPEQAS